MKLIDTIKRHRYQGSMDKSLKNLQVYGLFFGGIKNAEKLTNHCIADRLTPEEGILHILSSWIDKAEHYYQCIFLSVLYVNSGELKADNWYEISNIWRDNGKVSRVSLNEFTEQLNKAKIRWPQLFSGERPFVHKYWEVHFDYRPSGIATSSPARKPVKTFESFSEATEYVRNNSSEDYWWHSIHLHKSAQNGNIPAWKNSPAPIDYDDEFETEVLGFNRYRVDSSAKCVVATPLSSYDNWIKAVKEDDIYRSSTIINGYIYNEVLDVGAWYIRYVEVEEPIDTINHEANIPEAYKISLKEYLSNL